MVLAIDMIVPMPRSATPLLMVRANTAEGDGMLAFKYLFRESGGGKDSVIALISDDGDAHVQHGALVLVLGRDALDAQRGRTMSHGQQRYSHRSTFVRQATCPGNCKDVLSRSR